MRRQSVSRDGNMFLQYGGDETDLEYVLSSSDSWGTYMFQSGRAPSFIYGLATIKPKSQTTDAEYRRDLSQLLSEFGLSYDESQLDSFTTDTFEPMSQAIDDAIETAEEDDLYVYAPGQQVAVGNDVDRPPPFNPEWKGNAPPKDVVNSRARGTDAGPTIAQTNAATDSVHKVLTEIQGASAMERIKLLEVLQMDPNLQAMAKAGLLNWGDLMKPNDGSVVGPDGTKPQNIIDEVKLQDLRSKLLRVGLQQQDAKEMQVQQYRQRRTTTGPKDSTGFFGNKKVYMGPRYLPGRIPNKKNVTVLK